VTDEREGNQDPLTNATPTARGQGHHGIKGALAPICQPKSTKQPTISGDAPVVGAARR
jgi:hypothetical protein